MDHSIRELTSMRIRLRGDLVFTPQAAGSRPYYMVEDPLNSRFFRLGPAEYTFLSLLDGDTSIYDALSHLSSASPGHGLTESDAAGLCRWLVEMDLAHTRESSQADRLADSASVTEQKQMLAKWNPLVFKLPLGRPDKAFCFLNRWVGWLYSPVAGALALVLLTIAGYQVFSAREQFNASSQGIFAPGNWIWLLGVWAVLKIVHEIGHGVACKRYGGAVRETGLMFIMFAPLAYVDVTTSWRFRSRWERIHVAAAGMMIELLIAAVAALVWSATEPGWLNHLCFNIIVMASVTTLVFNANPLMKFDGYYILSDALSMPNLYSNGQTAVSAFTQRWFLGIPVNSPDWSRRDRILIKTYGWGSLVWRMLICVSMILTAATLFHGAGVVLAVFAGVLWMGAPAVKFCRQFISGETGAQRPRALLIAGGAIAAAVIVFGVLPWPGSRAAPVVVEYSPHTVVRAASPGFISAIHITSGQRVEAGQLLIELNNPELVRELADLKLQIRQSELRARKHEQKGELAAKQAEGKQQEGLRTQLAEMQIQVDRLTVIAPEGGQIIARNIASQLGAYLEQGDEILSLGDETKKELRLSIDQNDLHAFTERVGKPVRIDVAGRPLWSSALEKVIPRATIALPHPALIAANGGPLPVKPVSAEHSENSEDSFELLSPRFTGVVPLSKSESRSLFAGQQGQVSCRPLSESIGQHLYYAATDWIRQRLSPQG